MPYEIKTLDCPVVSADGTAILTSDGHPQKMRCVREVACRTVGTPIDWLLISWYIAVPAVVFRRCCTMDECLAAFHTPPEPFHLT